jgi:predicted  nucleic acid-binding Zn-ribbon protein
VNTTNHLNELKAIQRKLDRWELDHLREHAAQLADELAAAREEIEQLKRELSWAEASAEMFQDISEEIRDYTGVNLALTKNGQLHVLSEVPA